MLLVINVQYNDRTDNNWAVVYKCTGMAENERADGADEKWQTGAS